MSTYNKRIEEWFDTERAQIMEYVIDRDQLLTSDSGHKKGAYLFLLKMVGKDIPVIPMYAGETGADGENDRCFADRIKEHLYHWLYKDHDTEYHIGVPRSWFESGKAKLDIRIAGIAHEPKVRKKFETLTILRRKPYLQYGPYRKYPSKYSGIDLCIVPWDRRKALNDRLKELGVNADGDYNESGLIDKILNKGYKPDWKKIAEDKYCTEPYATNFRKLIKQGSELHKDVKAALEEAMGIVSGGRCTGIRYDRLITLLSNAMAEADGATE